MNLNQSFHLRHVFIMTDDIKLATRRYELVRKKINFIPLSLFVIIFMGKEMERDVYDHFKKNLSIVSWMKKCTQHHQISRWIPLIFQKLVWEQNKKDKKRKPLQTRKKEKRDNETKDDERFCAKRVRKMKTTPVELSLSLSFVNGSVSWEFFLTLLSYSMLNNTLSVQVTKIQEKQVKGNLSIKSGHVTCL